MTIDTMKIERWIAEGNIMRAEDLRVIEARARANRSALLGALLATGWNALRGAAAAAMHRADPRLPAAA